MLCDIFDPIEFAIMRGSVINSLIKNSFRYTDEPSFKLACGEMSRYYVNCKETIMRPFEMQHIGALFLKSVANSEATAIGGLTLGADPISNAVALVSGLYYEPYKKRGENTPLLKSFSVRKELKNHGVIKWIEGPVTSGEKVIIVDDVCTTGGSTIKAIKRARVMGLEVVGVRIFVDRQEMNGMDNIRKHVSDVQAILTIKDLLL